MKTLLAFAMAAIVAAPTLAQDTPTSSVQEETPFLWSGQIYADPEARITPQVREYVGNIPFLYPNAASCIKGEPDNLQEAELLWFDLADKRTIEVCLFRLFSALGSFDKAAAWLEALGWNETFNQRTPAHFYGVPDGELRQINFSWNINTQGAPYGLPERRAYLSENYKSITVSLKWSDNDGLRGLRITEQSNRQK